MEIAKWIVIVIAILVLTLGVASGVFLTRSTVPPGRPFPQHTEYVAGSVRPTIRTQAELDEEVAEYYMKWRERYLWMVPNTDPAQKLVLFALDAAWVDQWRATVSEAHGYGMMILAAMAGYDPHAQRDFNAMFRLYEAHPSAGDPRFMCWDIWFVEEDDQITGVKNTPKGPFSATDGDMDIAYALLMAHEQWGSDGEINYKAEALEIIRALMESAVCHEQWVLLLGDWVTHALEGDYDPRWRHATRSSDFMLHHLHVFAQVDEGNREKWMKVYDRKIEIINQTHEKHTPSTALLPDFFELKDGEFVPAIGFLLETEHDGDFGFNACRIPWRLGVAYLLLGEEAIMDELRVLNSWIREAADGTPLNINPGYYVRNAEEGTPIIQPWEGTCMSFIAPFAVSAGITENHQDWLNTLWLAITADDWEQGIPFDAVTYYPNTIRMIVMLIVSGNWWLPLNS